MMAWIGSYLYVSLLLGVLLYEGNRVRVTRGEESSSIVALLLCAALWPLASLMYLIRKAFEVCRRQGK